MVNKVRHLKTRIVVCPSQSQQIDNTTISKPWTTWEVTVVTEETICWCLLLQLLTIWSWFMTQDRARTLQIVRQKWAYRCNLFLQHCWLMFPLVLVAVLQKWSKNNASYCHGEISNLKDQNSRYANDRVLTNLKNLSPLFSC